MRAAIDMGVVSGVICDDHAGRFGLVYDDRPPVDDSLEACRAADCRVHVLLPGEMDQANARDLVIVDGALRWVR